MVPKEMPAKALAAPLYLPVGMVGGVLDVFLIHPILVIPDAWDTTVESLWTGGAGYVTAMGSLPIRTALTPVLFSLMVLFESAFDTSNDAPAVEPNANMTLDQVVAQGDAAKLEAFLSSSEGRTPADNPTLRRIFETSTSTIHSLALYRLGDEALFGLNEQYLIAQLGKKPEDDSALGQIFLQARSKPGARALLNQLASGSLSQTAAKEYIQILLQFEDAELTKALLFRIQTGREK